MLAYLFVTTIHDLVCDLFDIVLYDLRLILVLQAEGLVISYLLLLLFNRLVGGTLLLLLWWHFCEILVCL